MGVSRVRTRREKDPLKIKSNAKQKIKKCKEQTVVAGL
jgi:hypothetical protein